MVSEDPKMGSRDSLIGAPGGTPKHLLEMLLRLEMAVKILLVYSRVIARCAVVLLGNRRSPILSSNSQLGGATSNLFEMAI